MKPAVLVTGASGEMGHGLINFLADEGKYDIIATDFTPLDRNLNAKCSAFYQGNILDNNLIGQISVTHQFRVIYHLASILSSAGERDPYRTHEVNVEGAFSLLNIARNQSQLMDEPVIFMFPSSIAVYGMPNLEIKASTGKVGEDNFLHPILMYGMNKLYVEHLGRYFSGFYKLLAGSNGESGGKVDFRSIRFPGILSADTLPTGGTTDFAPYMVHCAAKGEAYESFCRPDTRLPFMLMPEAVKALIQLTRANKSSLTKTVYNVGSFSTSAEEIRSEVLKSFPSAKIGWGKVNMRQTILDSWPADVDDTAARTDWGWRSKYSMVEAFSNYLIPAVTRRYQNHLQAALNS